MKVDATRLSFGIAGCLEHDDLEKTKTYDLEEDDLENDDLEEDDLENDDLENNYLGNDDLENNDLENYDDLENQF